eukprot:TRINITY_DN2000_c0_g1_i1.p1 TRINITY_DN2000_c0_g1~~TRINITY_DN2000_c0_g1_i1.p1  ORF type:complete len:299 (+),score=65.16 TRINITY_DN2000_c0_g1_i1:60-956(+)
MLRAIFLVSPSGLILFQKHFQDEHTSLIGSLLVVLMEKAKLQVGLPVSYIEFSDFCVSLYTHSHSAITAAIFHDVDDSPDIGQIIAQRMTSTFYQLFPEFQGFDTTPFKQFSHHIHEVIIDCFQAIIDHLTNIIPGQVILSSSTVSEMLIGNKVIQKPSRIHSRLSFSELTLDSIEQSSVDVSKISSIVKIETMIDIINLIVKSTNFFGDLPNNGIFQYKDYSVIAVTLNLPVIPALLNKNIEINLESLSYYTDSNQTYFLIAIVSSKSNVFPITHTLKQGAFLCTIIGEILSQIANF